MGCSQHSAREDAVSVDLTQGVPEVCVDVRATTDPTQRAATHECAKLIIRVALPDQVTTQLHGFCDVA